MVALASARLPIWADCAARHDALASASEPTAEQSRAATRTRRRVSAIPLSACSKPRAVSEQLRVGHGLLVATPPSSARARSRRPPMFTYHTPLPDEGNPWAASRRHSRDALGSRTPPAATLKTFDEATPRIAPWLSSPDYCRFDPTPFTQAQRFELESTRVPKSWYQSLTCSKVTLSNFCCLVLATTATRAGSPRWRHSPPTRGNLDEA